MILRLNFALDSAVKTKGEPPALFTTDVEPAVLGSTIASIMALTASSSRMSQGWNS